MNKSIRFIASILFLNFVLSSCGGSSSKPDPDPNPDADVVELENQIRSALDALTTDADFTLLLTANNGRQFSHSIGTSTATTSYRSASTSKWVTAAIILDLVVEGILSLDDNPQDYIANWPTTGNFSAIQLRHLLTFTSGLSEEPFCLFPGTNIDMSDCVENVLAANSGAVTPGTEFYYSSSHLQVAGLMAIEATNAADWGEIFDDFKTKTDLFTTAIYDLPGTNNPRLAGGMHWTAEEYLAFLNAIYFETILTPDTITEMTSDQFNGATVVYSPVSTVNQDWHYGYGNWIECNTVVFNCTTTSKTSSPGAYGAYPFIDFEHGYFGIIAREGALGSFTEGYTVFNSVKDLMEEWASMNQQILQ